MEDDNVSELADALADADQQPESDGEPTYQVVSEDGDLVQLGQDSDDIKKG